MSFLPLFPLSMVAFPGEEINLHIFEPRYRQLILEAEEDKTTFGLAAINKKSRIEVGTEMQLTEIAHTYPDGKMDVTTRALRAFSIIDFYPKAEGKLYPAGQIEYFAEHKANTNKELGELVVKSVRELYELAGLQKEVADYGPSFKLYDLVHKLGLSVDEEISLLKLKDDESRLAYIYEHLQNMLPIIRRTEELKQKVKMNGHFKRIDPAEFNFFK